jgi:hypothetical protein
MFICLHGTTVFCIQKRDADNLEGEQQYVLDLVAKERFEFICGDTKNVI